jgi:flagellar biogenesis protein FliO
MGFLSVAALQLKKRAKKNADAASQIEVLASHAFSPKQRMNVVQIGGERMLVAVSDKGIQLLCGLRPEQAAPSFEQTLGVSLTNELTNELPSEPSPEIAGILRMKRARDAARGLS